MGEQYAQRGRTPQLRASQILRYFLKINVASEDRIVLRLNHDFSRIVVCCGSPRRNSRLRHPINS
jgi:hypothetical protein